MKGWIGGKQGRELETNCAQKSASCGHHDNSVCSIRSAGGGGRALDGDAIRARDDDAASGSEREASACALVAVSIASLRAGARAVTVAIEQAAEVAAGTAGGLKKNAQ